IKMLLPLLVAKVTYSEQKTSNGNHSKIFNLVIDEANNILSDRSSIESEKWKDYRLDVFEEIIKEGRKFGYYLTIASQRPGDISATIVSQVHNYFIHRLVNDNDLKMLQNTLSSLCLLSTSDAADDTTCVKLVGRRKLKKKKKNTQQKKNKRT
ncbi:ATP-binding protein, partial [Lactobacillus taiwanensis]|uniref:ATP-binding protein n=1 Tax=Lactobacillus taiwanensis TaxID=508451 RepID=UPI0036F1BAE6